jgi:hypothetical protein
MVKCLDINTGHLTEKDNSLLEEASKDEPHNANPVVAYCTYTEGYFVYCDEEGVREVDSGEGEYGYLSYGYSTQFLAILKRAKELGCKYVQFDCDGISYEDLETYEW